jgi:hypothetical protein
MTFSWACFSLWSVQDSLTFPKEMSINVDAISGCIRHQCLDNHFFATPLRSDLKEAFLIDGNHNLSSFSVSESMFGSGLDITANRLFGPQPRTAAYCCMWEIRFGDFRGTMSISDSRILMGAMTAFRLNFVDKPNAPAKEYSPPLDPDGQSIQRLGIWSLKDSFLPLVTVIRVSVDSIDLVLLAGQSTVVVIIPKRTWMASNNRAGQSYYRVTSFRLPQASLKLLLGIGARPISWIEALELSFDVSIDIYSSPPGWELVASTQKKFIEMQDALTGRANILLDTATPRKGTVPLRLRKLVVSNSPYQDIHTARGYFYHNPLYLISILNNQPETLLQKSKDCPQITDGHGLPKYRTCLNRKTRNACQK